MYIAITDSIEPASQVYMSGKFVLESGCQNVDADEGELYKKDGQFSLACYLKYTDGVWLLCNETYRRDHEDLYRISSKGKHYRL